MAARVNVLTRRKDDTRKQGAEIPVRVGAFDPIYLPGVLLEAEHDVASS
jgi:ATP-dependent DNA ligase